jgi:hypothetical protein
MPSSLLISTRGRLSFDAAMTTLLRLALAAITAAGMGRVDATVLG